MGNGGEAVRDVIRAVGTSHLFGLLGSSTMELYDALYDSGDIRYVGVRDERAGTHMADAFARLSQAPGMILAGQAGPGAANLVTGLAQAKLAYSPVVAITGLASTEHLGRDAFQEIDQQALFSAVTKRTITVSRAERVPEMLLEACRVAMSGRRGPVVVNIPRDYFAAQFEVSPGAVRPLPCPVPATASAEVAGAVARLLLEARAPVIIAGAGVKWSRGVEAVTALSRKLGIPLLASAGHGDVVPNDHPLFFGQVGPRGNPVASRLSREADVILALGTRLGFNTTFYAYNDIARDAKIVQVDIEPSALGRHFPVELAVAANAGAVATAIASQVPEDAAAKAAWRQRVAAAVEERERLLDAREQAGKGSTASPLTAERVFHELRQAMPREAVVTLDAGTMCLQATDQLRYYATPGLITPLDFGLVGFSYAAGIGAKCAAPGRPVVTLMGDGGFAMTMAEITTAVQHEIATVAVVLDNGCWGAEKAYQRDFYNGRYIGSDVLSPAYDQVAKLCGAEGYAASRPGELAAALEAALASGKPAVIHAKVDPNAIVSFRRDSFKHRGG